MKKQLFSLAAAVLAIAAVSCKPEAPADSVTLSSEKTINAPCEGGNYDVVFTSNVDWTANYSAGADNFFSLDKTTGKAGTASLKLTVQKNETYETRTGTVTIKAGTASEVITVKQDPLGETSETVTLNANYMAQDLSTPVKANPDKITVLDDAKDWVTAAAGNGAVTFTLKENATGNKRTGHVDILIVKHTVHVTIDQEAESGALKNPKVSYLGARQNFYDKGYTTFRQFLLAFDSEYGKVNLVVCANPAEGTVDKTAAPTGTFTEDAAGTYADRTFSVADKLFVTNYSVGETVFPVVGGEIVIAKSGSDYDIKATLINEANVQKIFTFKGALPAAEDDSFDGYVDGNTITYANSNTYFAGNAWEWSITFFFTGDPGKKSDSFPSWVTFKFYTAAGSSTAEIPTGDFSYEEAETDANYAQGNLKAKPGTFSFSGNDIPQNPLRVNADKVKPTLKITKTADGKYTFALKSNITLYKTGDTPTDIATYDWNPEVTVEAPKLSPGMMAHPDGDAVLDTPPAYNPSYNHMWYADAWKNGTNAFVFNMTYINDVYNIYLTFCSGTVWEAYAATAPIPAGTYTFSNSTTTAPGTIVPTLYCYIQNSYTGTTYKVNGGTVKLTDTDIEYNLTGKSTDGKTARFTGKYNTSVARCVNRSAERYATQMTVTPVE